MGGIFKFKIHKFVKMSHPTFARRLMSIRLRPSAELLELYDESGSTSPLMRLRAEAVKLQRLSSPRPVSRLRSLSRQQRDARAQVRTDTREELFIISTVSVLYGEG